MSGVALVIDKERPLPQLPLQGHIITFMII